MNLVKQRGFKNPLRFTMNDIQLERTGERAPFDHDGSGWIELVTG
ncbi:MAG: hypothetical protein ABJA71_14240 [Ginsengibacter sp.]